MFHVKLFNRQVSPSISINLISDRYNVYVVQPMWPYLDCFA